MMHNIHDSIRDLFSRHVVPSYGRFDLVLDHGKGVEVFDVSGRRYLDMGGGIAVNCLGHAHPAITEALVEQSRKLVHVSNLYYTEEQGRLAAALTGAIGAGKVFFCNSGAEANEGLFKTARKFGHDQGRYEILTAFNSFHGRTLGGIAATGQDKVKKGFEPIMPGFRHIPFNDLNAAREAVSPSTAAILVEGIQGEGGLTPATAEYLLGLRALCDEKQMLLLMDGVQCGHFRTGRFQSFQRILENHPGAQGFLPDGIAMAKSLGGGFPIGAFWLRAPIADLLGAGSHGTTYGGSPLACAVALGILGVIEKEKLADHARQIGGRILSELTSLARQHPGVLASARGLGLMTGFELVESHPAFTASARAASLQVCDLFHQAGLLTAPAGSKVIRLLPPLNLSNAEADEALAIIKKVVQSLDGRA